MNAVTLAIIVTLLQPYHLVQQCQMDGAAYADQVRQKFGNAVDVQYVCQPPQKGSN